MNKLFKLLVHPITRSNECSKEYKLKDSLVLTLIFFILMSFTTIIYGKYLDFTYFKYFEMANIFLSSCINLFILGIITSISAILVMWITFECMAAIMNIKKSHLTMYSFTIVGLFSVSIGLFLSALFLNYIPSIAIMLLYSTFIYYSISMITASVKFFNINDPDKYALVWTLISLGIFSLAIILGKMFFGKFILMLQSIF